MKRKIPNPNSHFFRRITYILRSIRRWYSYLSGRSIPARGGFFGSCLFYDKDIPVARPLAYWTIRHGWKKWFTTSTYFLYEYQHGETINSIVRRLKRRGRYEDVRQWYCKIFLFIKQVHLAGLRHGDQKPENFIVSAPQQTECFPDIKLASMRLIDMDSGKLAKYRHTLVPAVEHFFAFEDLTKGFAIGHDRVVSLLRVYLGREPTSYDLWLMSFWRGGGIRIRLRLRGQIRKWDKQRKRLRRQIRQWYEQRKKRKHGRY